MHLLSKRNGVHTGTANILASVEEHWSHIIERQATIYHTGVVLFPSLSILSVNIPVICTFHVSTICSVIVQQSLVPLNIVGAFKAHGLIYMDIMCQQLL